MVRQDCSFGLSRDLDDGVIVELTLARVCLESYWWEQREGVVASRAFRACSVSATSKSQLSHMLPLSHLPSSAASFFDTKSFPAFLPLGLVRSGVSSYLTKAGPKNSFLPWGFLRFVLQALWQCSNHVLKTSHGAHPTAIRI